MLHKNVTLSVMQAKNLRRNSLRKIIVLVFWLTNLYQKEVMKYQQASGIEDNVQKIRLLQEGT